MIANGRLKIYGSDVKLPVVSVPSERPKAITPVNTIYSVLKENRNNVTFEEKKIRNSCLYPPPVPKFQQHLLSEMETISSPASNPKRVQRKIQRISSSPPHKKLCRNVQSMQDLSKLNVITKQTTSFPANKKRINKKHHPSLPPKPRTVILERWLPYDPPPKRKIIYEKAKVVKYKVPKNLVIIYDQPKPIITRHFRKCGVFLTDPQLYTAYYGDSLLDSPALEYVAKLAGVYEDISVPKITNQYIEAY